MLFPHAWMIPAVSIAIEWVFPAQIIFALFDASDPKAEIFTGIFERVVVLFPRLP